MKQTYFSVLLIILASGYASYSIFAYESLLAFISAVIVFFLAIVAYFHSYIKVSTYYISSLKKTVLFFSITSLTLVLSIYMIQIGSDLGMNELVRNSKQTKTK